MSQGPWRNQVSLHEFFSSVSKQPILLAEISNQAWKLQLPWNEELRCPGTRKQEEESGIMTPISRGVPTEGARKRPAAPAACLRALTRASWFRAQVRWWVQVLKLCDAQLLGLLFLYLLRDKGAQVKARWCSRVWERTLEVDISQSVDYSWV